jgi:hypothetical protein
MSAKYGYRNRVIIPSRNGVYSSRPFDQLTENAILEALGDPAWANRTRMCCIFIDDLQTKTADTEEAFDWLLIALWSCDRSTR